MTTSPVVPAPDAFDRAGERIADAVNPIIVKEVRQGLRTRVFWIFFALMLLACLFISLIFFAENDGFGDRSGQGAFIAFFVCLALVQFFVIPYAAYRSMAREAEDETWVLLTLTGIGPRRILSGKVGSSVLQGSLYASAATPFLLFSYFLNGIDLPTIIVAVVISVAYQVFLVAVSVSLATLAETKIVRALLHFVLLGVLLQGLGMGIAGSVAIGEFAQKISGRASFWLAAGSVFFGMLTTGLLLFEAAAARLSLPTEDYARGPRRVFIVQFLGALALFGLGWHLSGEEEALTAASVTLSLYAALVGLFVASDRDGMARVHWLNAGRFSLLRPGGLRGFSLVVLLLVFSMGVLAALAFGFTSLRMGPMLVLLGAPGYAVMMLSLSTLVARWIPHPPWQTPAMIRLVFLGLMVLLIGVPPLVGELISDADDLLLNALNPVVGLINLERQGDDGVPLLLLVWGVAAGLFAAAFTSLRARDTEWLA